MTAAVSLLVHALALIQWMPQLKRAPSDLDDPSRRAPLIVQIEPEAAPPRPRAPAPEASRPARPPPPPRAAAPRSAPSKAPRERRAPPPVLALEKTAPAAPPSPPARAPAETVPPPTKAPSAADLLAYVEAQRKARRDLSQPESPRERAPSPSPPEDEQARANRIAAANLGLGRKPEMGGEQRRSGGIFDIRRMSYDYAEFMFHGWNRDMRRNTAQVIEVRKGPEPDIKIAVIRRMIGIIRDHEQGDFVWESRRLGRNVTLSARLRDQAGLESFLWAEFFGPEAR